MRSFVALPCRMWNASTSWKQLESQSAFAICLFLRNIKIPSVGNIEAEAFDHCKSVWRMWKLVATWKQLVVIRSINVQIFDVLPSH